MRENQRLVVLYALVEHPLVLLVVLKPSHVQLIPLHEAHAQDNLDEGKHANHARNHQHVGDARGNCVAEGLFEVLK